MNIAERIRRKLFLKRIEPDRHAIENCYYPTVKAKTILIVGVAEYCKATKILPKNNKVYSIDSKPEMARYGSKDMHLVDSILNINKHFSNATANGAVMVSGIGCSGNGKTNVFACKNKRLKSSSFSK